LGARFETSADAFARIESNPIVGVGSDEPIRHHEKRE